ncbi:C40 family peptidase [Dactylosporangium fulvum]|uniref:NlpC/P60 family protein n=1 Tax=Dactylosporangium fulvum TaxID=53359 RepID=A0ABY5VT16_9ACTN|nr:C40 family peptidase [Dactylosporangium fulvum]UWP79964.1 NlpC/P60 family protein [Dactylosporangium fulvum]
MPPRCPRRVRSHPARAARLAAAALAAVIAILMSTGAAHAEPSPAQLEAQIDEAWNQLEPTIEKYNQVHTLLKDNQAKAAALQRQLQPLEAQVEAAMGQVSEIAVRAFKGGQVTALDVLLHTDSPEALLGQLAVVNEIARNQRASVRSVAEARDKLAGDKQALDAIIAQQSQQDADLAAKKKEIEGKIAELQKLRQQAYGSGGGTGALKPVACPVDYLGGPGGTAAKKACSLIGKPYVWGAAGPDGYDCSGLTLTAWAAAGVKLRHYTKWQWEDTKAVSRSELRPGDLVFFFSDLHHMGLYVGGGWMVHAPTTGDHVRMAKLEGRPITGYRRPG